jgi:Protein of unknown function (DUF3054)
VPRLTDGTAQSRLTLGFDVGAIAGFILVGMNSHSDTAALSTFLRNFVPFTGAWVVTSLFTGTYRPPTPLAALLLTIVIAIPAGVLLRAALVGSSTASDVVTFMAVALLFASIFIGLGRVLSAMLGVRLFGERS